MEFKLNRIPSAGADAGTTTNGFVSAEEGSFSISARPVVQETESNEKPTEQSELPRTYGTQSVWLMPRDPHSIFAYWDVDWHRALGEKLPVNRKAHLRVFDADGSQLLELEVEPMAGSCFVSVEADESYSAELGYYSPAGTWNSLATSATAATPGDASGGNGLPEFATVPFHLSFQHMVDLLRRYKQENESLTARLNELRQGDSSTPPVSNNWTAEQQDLARAIEAATAQQPAPNPSASSSPDLWQRQNFGSTFGVGPFSPGGGFGGSSHHFGS